MSDSVVYFVRNPAGLIKIGTSRRVGERIDNLENSAGHDFAVLAIVPGSFELERELHKRFDHVRERGEWFRPCSDLLELVEKAKERRLEVMPCGYAHSTPSSLAVPNRDKLCAEIQEEMREAIVRIGGPREDHETRESWLSHAARRAGVQYRIAKGLYYREIKDPRWSIVMQVRQAAAKIAPPLPNESETSPRLTHSQFVELVERIDRLENELEAMERRERALRAVAA